MSDSHSDDWGSNPHRSISISHEIDDECINTKGKLKNLTDTTIRQYTFCHNIFLKFINGRPVTQQLIEKYYIQCNQRRNNLGMLRLLYHELSKNCRFPKKVFKPKILPSKEQLNIFYQTLPRDYQIIFLLLSESGLRISELLDCTVDKSNKMLIPNGHTGQTKHSWISFYQTDFDEIPKVHKDTIGHVFKRVSKKTGIKVNPHLLRSVFAREMSRAGVQDRFIDAFCGRTPQSVLARSYTDFSSESLKEIYIKADIKIIK